MKPIFCLILVGTLAFFTGCVDFAGNALRNSTVSGKLPPPIDANVPQPIERENPLSPQGRADRTSGQNSTAARSTSRRPAFTDPVTPDQVERDPFGAGEALNREMDRDSMH